MNKKQRKLIVKGKYKPFKGVYVPVKTKQVLTKPRKNVIMYVKQKFSSLK